MLTLTTASFLTPIKVGELLLAGLLVAAALVAFAQRREALNLGLPTVLATMMLACLPLGLYVLRG